MRSTGAVIEMKCHCTATFLTHHNQGHFWVVASNVFYFDLSFYYSGMLGSEEKKRIGKLLLFGVSWRMTKARFWLLCWVTVLVWQHPLRFFSRSFERAANVSSSWEVLTFQIYSIQSRCGVIWDPFSSDLGSICDTICLQKSHPNTQCGWQSTEKIQSFSCLSKISKKSQCLKITQKVSFSIASEAS